MSADHPSVSEPGAAPLEERYAQVRARSEQGQMQQAGDLCSTLLRECPNDPEPHALMGDLYAARRLWREAIEWYNLAEQRGAGPEVARRRAAAQAELAPRQPAAEEPPPESELHRQRTRLLAIFGGAGVVVLVAVILALLALSGQSQAPDTRPVQPGPVPQVELPGGRPSASRSAPLTGSPAPTPGEAPRVPQPGTPAPALPGPGGALPPVVITEEMSVPITDEDYLIAAALGSLKWPDGTKLQGDVSVMMDPYLGYCVITFRIPEGLPGDTLADTVTEQAYRVALAALGADAGIQSLTLRVIGTLTLPDRQHQNLVVFRANTTRPALEYWSKLRAKVTPQQIRDELFASAWWNPSVPTDRLR